MTYETFSGKYLLMSTKHEMAIQKYFFEENDTLLIYKYSCAVVMHFHAQIMA